MVDEADIGVPEGEIGIFTNQLESISDRGEGAKFADRSDGTSFRCHLFCTRLPDSASGESGITAISRR